MTKYHTYLFAVLMIVTTQFKAQSVGGITSGSASYCVGNNSGFISLTGYTGIIQFWESSIDGTNWTNIPNPTSTQSYLNLTQTTDYRAIVQDGAFPQDTSTIATITLYTPADGGVVSGGGTFCMQAGAGTLTLSGETGNVVNWQFSEDGGVTWIQILNTTPTLNYTTITQNTIYTAVVENVPGCPLDTSSTAVFFIDSSSVAGVVAGESLICNGENDNTLVLTGEFGVVLDWISSVDGGSSWISEGIVSNTLTNQNLIVTTEFSAIVQNGVCPADTSISVELTVVNPVQVVASEDVIIILHEATTISATGAGAVVWSPSLGLDDSLVASPSASPIITTEYVVSLTDANGCNTTDTVTVTVSIPIPSAITPNEDNVNDYFYIDNIEKATSNSLAIFNRHGNVVYEKSPYDNTWNGVATSGKNLPDGVYYYVLDLGNDSELINGYVLIKR